MRKLLLMGAVILVQLTVSAQHERDQFSNLLDMRQSLTMNYVNQTGAMVFSDQGAWHGYSLPAKAVEYGGFNGPVLFNETGFVLSESFAKVSLQVDNKPYAFYNPVLTYLPGLLQQQYQFQEINLKESLIFVDQRTAVVKVEISNTSTVAKKVDIKVEGALKDAQFRLEASDNVIAVATKNAQFRSAVIADRRFNTTVTGTTYVSATTDVKNILPGTTYVFYIWQACTFGNEKNTFNLPSVPAIENSFPANKNRWQTYINNTLNRDTKWLKEESYKRLAVKSLLTLTTNWRSPAGDLKHDGIFPSYNFFDGFWAWDSWKHAAACALFDTELAENNIRSMFDYQDDQGMIADCVFFDSERNNYRNTKPPLAAWAVWKVYDQSKNIRFLEEVYPKLVIYHKWWYKNRDHDNNGLCEFGSTNGERVAAAWESGMDNAVRFDSAQMLKNNDHAWSLDQESVDLNSFLYLEKKLLAKMASVLGNAQQSAVYNRQATNLQQQVKKRMFDEKTGFYYDVKLTGKDRILLQGPEGWQPLWTGLASKQQAKSIVKNMIDEKRFNTYLPFPTFQANHPAFDPKAYWRGPVWMDQAMFAIEGLRNYGENRIADDLMRKLLNNGGGILTDEPLRETYNPLTGEGMTIPNFSWTAACLLQLLCE